MTKPKPIAEAIASMEEQIAIMRKMIATAPTAPAAEDETTRMSAGGR